MKKIVHRLVRARHLLVFLLVQIKRTATILFMPGLGVGPTKRMAILARAIKNGINGFGASLIDLTPRPVFSSKQLDRLRRQTLGLHQHLNRKTGLRFSILMPVLKPKGEFFRAAMRSALSQTSPNFEILVGFGGGHDELYLEIIKEEVREAKFGTAVRTFDVEIADGVSGVTNFLAAQANGDWLVLFHEEGWLRPDFLFRYEQTLFLHKLDPELVLYCNEFKVDASNHIVGGSFIEKPLKPEMPFLFLNWVCHCLCVPMNLWHEVGGLRPDFDGAEDYDLVLRLSEHASGLLNVPIALYASRESKKSTVRKAFRESPAHTSGLNALKDYLARRGLNWAVSDGKYILSYRVIPKLAALPKVHVVVPYKDQRNLTLACFQTLEEQKGVDLFLTFVDNNSNDKSIGEYLNANGVEVISIDEPYNFSYLNNEALRRSKSPKGYDLVLFLNNDVELESDAIVEMARWAVQEKVGAVGCLLVYPDRLVQHGGIFWSPSGAANTTAWTYYGGNESNLDFGFHGAIHTPTSVTAACMMVRKSVFYEVDGFDEDFYPIAFSDTNLCMKIRKSKYTVLYTPFATGVHHESLSRGKYNIEDYEASVWLHRGYFQIDSFGGEIF